MNGVVVPHLHELDDGAEEPLWPVQPPGLGFGGEMGDESRLRGGEGDVRREAGDHGKGTEKRD